jgi:fumarylacetoacetase
MAHHTITGCNLWPGDLLGSGTISGPEENSFGSLLELSWNGTRNIQISENEQRTFWEDFD